MAFSAMLAQLNISQKSSAANLTGACPVKYIEDMERSEFNRGAGKGFFPTFIVGIQEIFMDVPLLLSVRFDRS
jgi:hypothetical protein